MNSCDEDFDLAALLAENERRHREQLDGPYDPAAGVGCLGERVRVALPHAAPGLAAFALVPACMQGHQWRTTLEMERERIACDFEYWCWRCVTIQQKGKGRQGRFVLNRPQRQVLATLEQLRLGGKPIRVIMLKARQWGGSTLVLHYMAWIQLVLRKGWNSVICGHQRTSTRAIKSMMRNLLAHYPAELMPADAPYRLRSIEGSNNEQEIVGRDCKVIMTSALSEHALRGYDMAMAHMSEVAFWPSTPARDPRDLVRTIDGSILDEPLTLEVMESTANGMGNFFHNEWLKAVAGTGNKVAVFVPWTQVDLYSSPVADAAHLWREMDPYERSLWHDQRCTLEQIQWYHNKRRGHDTHAAMMAEFPTTAAEAFAGTCQCVFAAADLDALRKRCRRPLLSGDLVPAAGSRHGCLVVENGTGLLRIWREPEPTLVQNRWVVGVDVGGRTPKADYSVVTVVDRGELPGSPLEMVAQWRGHCDHDLLAQRAVALARRYGQALLVIESNSLEGGMHCENSGALVLEQMAGAYANVYRRAGGRVGFQTNRSTKPKLVDNLIALLRQGRLVEPCAEAVDEMSCFEHTLRGGYGAIAGKHDDMVMSRALALYVAANLPRTQLARPADFVGR